MATMTRNKTASGKGANHHSPRTRTKGFRPKGPLGDAALDRGKQAYNLWYAFSPKASSDVVLKTDAEMLHAFWAQIDPTVVSFQTEAPRGIAQLKTGPRGTVFDAQVALADGSTELREIKPYKLPPSGPTGARARLQEEAQEQVAAALGHHYRRVGPEDFAQNAIAITNSMVATATLSAARENSYELQHAQLMGFFMRQSTWTANALLAETTTQQHPLLLAAVFRAVCKGELKSDLHERIWCGHTRLWLAQAEPSSTDMGPQASTTLDAADAARLRAAANAEANRAMRTADASAALALAIERADNTPHSQRYTRKNFPREYRDLSTWPPFDMDSIEDEVLKERAKQMRAALTGYMEGAPVRLLEEAHGIHRSNLLRALNRALVPVDGQIAGWRHLRPGAHLEGYTRSTPIERVEGKDSTGFAGSFGHLFARFPRIYQVLKSMVLKEDQGDFAEPVVGAARVLREFHTQCKAHGVSDNEYPFTTKDRGHRSIQRLVKDIREVNFARSARLLGGKGAGKRSKLENGFEPLLQHHEIYEAVEQDAHTLDVIGIVRIPHTKGTLKIPMKRMALQIIVDVESRAVLGYSLCVLGRISSNDAVAAVQHALSRWKPLTATRPLISYAEGAGFPSGLIPQLQGAAWSTHYLDNDSAYTSVLVAERIRNRVGCAVNYGPVGDWTRRHIVEGVFSVLAAVGFQRLPSTTGSHPKDPRRNDAEGQAVDTEFDYEDLVYLVDVALAGYNASALPSLGYRSPLQFLKEVVEDTKRSFLPRHLPELPHSTPELHIVSETVTVRGNLSEGRRPYVQVDGVHHTSQILAQCGPLIGKKLTLHINEADLRHVMAFSVDGRSLGALEAGEGWSRVKHTRSMRKIINRMRSDGSIVRRPDQDWVEAYLNFKTAEAAQAAMRKPKKVSSTATKVADIARKTGLPIPTVESSGEQRGAPSPVTQLTEASPPAQRKATLPLFLVRPVRRATY